MRKTKHDHLRRGAALIAARALLGPSGAVYREGESFQIGTECRQGNTYPGPLTQGNIHEFGDKSNIIRWPLPPVFTGAIQLSFVAMGQGSNWYEALINARRARAEGINV